MAYLPILASGVFYMLLGMLWYSPFLFGNSWMKLSGLTKESMEEKKPQMARIYFVSFIFAIASVWILSYLFDQLFITETFGAIGFAVTLWLGFSGLLTAGEYLYLSNSWTLFLINSGFRLLFLVGSAIILVSL